MKAITKIVKLQSSKYKIHSNGSNETSIFISHEDAESLKIRKSGPITFKIYKNDFIKGLGMLMALSDLPLYKKDVINFNIHDFQEYLVTIENFFGDSKKKDYEINFFINTSQADRNYFNNLEDHGLNIRNFLVENHSFLSFILNGNEHELRFKTELNEIKDESTVDLDKFNTVEINHPCQLIYFGAPGTGKSYQLKKDSEAFENQKCRKSEKSIDKESVKAEIRAAITSRGRKLTILNAIGFKYADFLKNEIGLSKEKIAKFCDDKNINMLYIGASAKFIADEQKIEDDKIIDDTFLKNYLLNERKNYDKLKLANAIGYKMGQSGNYNRISQREIETIYGSQDAWWLYTGIQAAKLNEEAQSIQEVPFVERVTFYPNYSYAQFVGTYKPVPNGEDEDQITYKYVPGPFMRVYSNAKKHTETKFLLLIEEINRSNVAAVFGDVFQLLDRTSNGESEYPITGSEDVRDYLASQGINENKLSIPSNMYIWATMNSADQGVMPMDAAFKRRWEFEYIGIDKNDGEVAAYEIPTHKDKNTDTYIKENWNKLRTTINEKLRSLPNINEDKLLGPFFLSLDYLEKASAASDIDADKYVKIFKSKVLMYLFEDVCKTNPLGLFSGVPVKSRLHYSDICNAFDDKGGDIFN